MVVRQAERPAVGHADHAGVAEDQRDQRPQIGGTGAQADQGVHGGSAVAQVHQCRAVERPGCPGDHRGGQRQADPLPSGELQRRDHRHRDDRHRQRGRDDQAALDLGRPIARLGFGDRQSGIVSGSLHGSDQIIGGQPGGSHHMGFLGCVVDTRLHSVKLAQLLLDTRRTRRAGHALHVEFDDLTCRRFQAGGCAVCRPQCHQASATL
ncbi:hypothetical protein SDC9_87672 [bioreactor metagenome]|uniref:Uncharacterized protein n=1 Tax=bioreactor metagenome TaxID=1076179 RepID=A0A644ZQW1_9ZZZZ